MSSKESLVNSMRIYLVYMSPELVGEERKAGVS